MYLLAFELAIKVQDDRMPKLKKVHFIFLAFQRLNNPGTKQF